MRVNITTSWDLTEANARQRREAKRALSDALEFVLQESNRKVPLDEGTLLRSGNVDIEDTRSKMTGSVFYDTPYAAKLHEHPEYNFQNHREGKYLEKTIDETKDEYKRYLVDAYRRAFGR